MAKKEKVNEMMPNDTLDCSQVIAQPYCNQRLNPSTDGKRYRDKEPNILQTLVNPVEEEKEGLLKPEKSRTPHENTLN